MLNVDDKLYRAYGIRGDNYEIATVVKVTEKQATLSNGYKVNRQGKQGSFDKFPYYTVIGDRREDFKVLTPEILVIIEAINKERRLNRWYRDFKPTLEQIEQIYNLINQTP